LSITICCVNAGNYQSRGAEYVNNLFDSISRNLAEGYQGKFVVFTDQPDAGYIPGVRVRPLPHPGLSGWYNKLALFKSGVFEDGDHVFFSDLDNLITGRLDEILAYRGDFAILHNVMDRAHGFGSAFMGWRVGAPGLTDIWTSFERACFPHCEEGDQEWIQRCMGTKPVDFWQDMFPKRFVSFRKLGRRMPEGASVVCFHGPENKPHLIDGGWVPEVWKLGGISHAELDVICNTENERILANFHSACARDVPWFDIQPEHDGFVLICGGGPSLGANISQIRAAKAAGGKIWALNGAAKYLCDHSIRPDAVVILDARPENAAFVSLPHWELDFLIASQCHPGVFETVPHDAKVTLYHNATEGVQELLEAMPGEQPTHLLGGGSTVGLKAMLLAYLSGYRKLHLYGMDGCYIDGQHHSYPQPLNEGEKALTVICEHRVFQCAPWMATQANEFNTLVDTLIENGCSISAAGEGLLAWIVAKKATPVEIIDGKFIEVEGFLTPYGDATSVYILNDNTALDVQEVLKYCGRRGTVVQAGGHVGIWPKELAKHFARVVTFEADPLNYEALMRNCIDASPVVAYNNALGDKPGYAGIAVDGFQNSSGRYLAQGEAVAIVTIDSLNLAACDAICLDVEGYEKRALEGAADTIRKFRPVITIEDNGLSTRYGVAHGETPDWICETFGYRVAERYRMDILLIPKEQH
jgi:FkbM family methyltransferase